MLKNGLQKCLSLNSCCELVNIVVPFLYVICILCATTLCLRWHYRQASRSQLLVVIVAFYKYLFGGQQQCTLIFVKCIIICLTCVRVTDFDMCFFHKVCSCVFVVCLYKRKHTKMIAWSFRVLRSRIDLFLPYVYSQISV